MSEILDIVNENDEIIGRMSRNDSDKSHYIFRMVFIGFYTDQKKIILQRRSILKKSGPGLLTSTVSGHVSSGQTYDDAALREAYEETGVVIDESKLVKLGVIRGADAMRALYAYPFSDPITQLHIEQGEGDGFVEMSIADLKSERELHPEKFTPFILGEAGTKLFDYIANLK